MDALCTNLQTILNDVAGSNAPSIKRDRPGYLEALLSEMNTTGVQQVPVPTNGKHRKVELIFTQRGVEADIAETQPTAFCDATDEPQPRLQVVEVTRWVHRKLRFTEDELRKFCFAEDKVFVANAIMAEINALLTKVNKTVIGIQGTNFGQFLDGSSAKPALLLGPGNTPNYFEESKMIEEYYLVGGAGRPLVVGAGALSHYVRMTGKGCCNTQGIDLSQAGDFAFFHDRFVNGVLGGTGEHYILLAPGAVQFISRTANTEQYAWTDGRDEAGTLMDPFTGVVFDVDKVWDKCAKRYNITISLNYDLYLLPPDAFKTTDELSGVNFSLHFTNP